jgi:hypothetical protein
MRAKYVDQVSAFQQIFGENRWQSSETRRRRGSTLAYSNSLRRALGRSLDVRVLLDAPCGDFNWMRHGLARGCLV